MCVNKNLSRQQTNMATAGPLIALVALSKVGPDSKTTTTWYLDFAVITCRFPPFENLSVVGRHDGREVGYS